MRKLGEWNRSWKNRFFLLSLDDGELVLRYYKDAFETKARGQVSFTGKTDVAIPNEKYIKKHKPPTKNVFFVKTEKRRWVFCCETESIRDKWIEVLKKSLVSNLDLDESSEHKDDDEAEPEAEVRTLPLDPIKWELLQQTDNLEVLEHHFPGLTFHLKGTGSGGTLQIKTKPGVNTEPNGQPQLLSAPVSLSATGSDSVSKNVKSFTKSLRAVQKFLRGFFGKGRLMSGYLDKRGKYNKAWKKRFCVLLDDGIFEYYARSTDAVPKGRILVSEIKSLGAGISLPRREVFHVVTKDRTWIFAAEDDRTRDLWIQHMEDFGKTDLLTSSTAHFFPPMYPDSPAARLVAESRQRGDLRSHRKTDVWKNDAKKCFIHVKSNADLLGAGSSDEDRDKKLGNENTTLTERTEPTSTGQAEDLELKSEALSTKL